MRIHDIKSDLKKIVEQDENKKRVKSDNKKVEESSSEISDKVEFSETLNEAKKLVIDILDYPENRTEKIERLREMIRSGKYNVDVHKLADKIVEDLIFGKFYK